MVNPDPLTAYLSTHDAPCPGCGYSLRGLASDICPECGRSLAIGELNTPLPRRTVRLADVWAVLVALPFVLAAAMIASLAIANDITQSWPVASALILACGVFVCFFLFPVRRLLRRKPSWIFLYNPVSLVIVLYLILIVGIVAIG